MLPPQGLADPFFQLELAVHDRVDESELKWGSKIGTGAYGHVVRAQWRETDVAVKKIPAQGELQAC